MLRGPAKYPPDWRWPYQFTNTLGKIWFPLVSLGLILLFAAFFEKRKSDFKNSLLILFFLSFIFQISVIFYSRAGLGVLVGRIINPDINGYFTASLGIHNIYDFLSNFSKNVANYPMYARFHPPGSILIFWFMNQISGLIPSLDFIQRLNFNHSDIKILWNSLPVNQKLTAFFAPFLLSLIASLTIIPIYTCAKILYSEKTAFWASLLYIFVPSVVLFLPLNDVFFPLFSAGALYFFVKGFIEESLKNIFISGIILFAGSFFTLTIIPLLFVFGLIYLFFQRKLILKRNFLLMGGFFLSGFSISPIILYLIFNFNSVLVLNSIMANHKQVVMYRTNPLWPIYNLYDFFVFLGLPLFIIFLYQFKETVVNLFQKKSLDIVFASFCLLIAALDILGTTNGETGRVWLPYIPLILLPLSNFLTEKLKFSKKQLIYMITLQGLSVILLQTFWVMVW